MMPLQQHPSLFSQGHACVHLRSSLFSQGHACAHLRPSAKNAQITRVFFCGYFSHTSPKKIDKDEKVEERDEAIAVKIKGGIGSLKCADKR